MMTIKGLAQRITAGLALLLLLTGLGTIVHASETITYVIPDAQGTSAVKLDEAGNVTWRAAHEPFGHNINLTNQQIDNNPLQYTGAPLDSYSGLTYLKARYYNAEIGRFYAIDPLWFTPDNVQMFGRYTYANNNPFKYTDPTGEGAIADGQGVEGIVDSTQDPEGKAASALEGAKQVADVLAFDDLKAIEKDLSEGRYAGAALTAVMGIAKVGKVDDLIDGITEAKNLGKFSAYAKNEVGQILSQNVTMTGKNITFGDFTIGTQRGLLGVGEKGANELIGPMKDLIAFSQKHGAETITLSGRFATSEGARLGGGKVGDTFSFSFAASEEGFRGFVKGLR